MGEVSTIGLDIAKSVLQVHGVDGAGAVVMRKRISRAKICSNQDERAAGWLDAAPNPAIAGASAHDVEQRPARALGGTGHRVGEGTQWHQSIAWHHHGRNR